MKIYKIPDLMQRYNIGTRQGAIKFVQSHLQEINADETHAKKLNGEWTFDNEALRLMDELRDNSSITIIEDHTEKLKEKEQQIEQLKEMLIMAQSELIETQKQLNLMLVESSKVQNKLISTKDNLESTQGKLTTTKVENIALKQKISKLENEVKEGRQAISTLNQLRQRSLIERILNKDFD